MNNRSLASIGTDVIRTLYANTAIYSLFNHRGEMKKEMSGKGHSHASQGGVPDYKTRLLTMKTTKIWFNSISQRQTESLNRLVTGPKGRTLP